MRRERWAGLTLAGVVGAGLLAGCAAAPIAPQDSTPAPPVISPSLSPALGSGIHGTVLAGPTCPVERLDSPCPPRPVAATIEAETAGGQIVATADSGAGGTYTLTLPPGSYTLVVAGPSPFPRCPPTPAVVASGTVATVAIECDTGIR